MPPCWYPGASGVGGEERRRQMPGIGRRLLAALRVQWECQQPRTPSIDTPVKPWRDDFRYFIHLPSCPGLTGASMADFADGGRVWNVDEPGSFGRRPRAMHHRDVPVVDGAESAGREQDHGATSPRRSAARARCREPVDVVAGASRRHESEPRHQNSSPPHRNCPRNPVERRP